jgi:hypothetical protein
VRYHALIKLTRRGVAALAATLVCAVALSAAAHDIPTDVNTNAFVKPEGKRLELLIRVPLAAMIEVDIPTRGPGYLDLSRAPSTTPHSLRARVVGVRSIVHVV